MLRTEEHRQAAKSNRMRHHLGVTRVKLQPNAQVACKPCLTNLDLTVDGDYISSATVQSLQKQTAQLQTQVAKLLTLRDEKKSQAKSSKQDKPKPADLKSDTKQKNSNPVPTSRPRPWYCFRCGEDAHIVSSCCNAPNPTLVQTKRQELREKQRAWDKQNGALEKQDLN